MNNRCNVRIRLMKGQSSLYTKFNLLICIGTQLILVQSLLCGYSSFAKESTSHLEKKLVEELGGLISNTDEAGRITGLSLRKMTLSKTDLQNLKSFTQLETLDLGLTRLPTDALKYLADLPNLRVLFLEKIAITDKSLSFVSGIKNLDTLVLNATSIRGAGLKALSKCTKLQELHIENTNINDEDLIYISDFPSLRKFNLCNCRVSERGIEKLSGMPKLTELFIGPCPFTDRMVNSLSRFPVLKSVWVSNSRIKLHNQTPVRRSIAVNRLMLVDCEISDKAVGILAARMKELESLTLFCTGWGDKGLGHLKILKKLTKLHIGNSNITDDGLSSLIEFPQLETLCLRKNSRISKAGIIRLAVLKKLQTLIICGPPNLEEGIRELQKLRPNLVIHSL